MLEPHLAGKTTKKRQNYDTPNPQTSQSFSMPHYSEKSGEIMCHQMPAPNLPGRCRPIGETTTELLLKYLHQDWMLKK
jgi:hypothetical protein